MKCANRCNPLISLRKFGQKCPKNSKIGTVGTLTYIIIFIFKKLKKYLE